MSKVFESQSLTDEADKRKKQYEALEGQLRALKQAFQGVADLGDALKGKGADNIKDFSGTSGNRRQLADACLCSNCVFKWHFR